MYRSIVIGAFAVFMAGPALAGATCSTAASTQYKPQEALETQLKSEGLTVREVKVENGCYEVYAVDSAGKQVNLAYNAETLEQVDDPEAGEN